MKYSLPQIYKEVHVVLNRDGGCCNKLVWRLYRVVSDPKRWNSDSYLQNCRKNKPHDINNLEMKLTCPRFFNDPYFVIEHKSLHYILHKRLLLKIIEFTEEAIKLPLFEINFRQVFHRKRLIRKRIKNSILLQNKRLPCTLSFHCKNRN